MWGAWWEDRRTWQLDLGRHLLEHPLWGPSLRTARGFVKQIFQEQQQIFKCPVPQVDYAGHVGGSQKMVRPSSKWFLVSPKIVNFWFGLFEQFGQGGWIGAQCGWAGAEVVALMPRNVALHGVKGGSNQGHFDNERRKEIKEETVRNAPPKHLEVVPLTNRTSPLPGPIRSNPRTVCHSSLHPTCRGSVSWGRTGHFMKPCSGRKAMTT